MVSHPDPRPRVTAALRRFTESRIDVLRRLDDELAPFARIAADILLREGKQLRPSFCYWGWRGAGGPDCDPIIAAAAALELLHAGALVHDDVMDDSATRRGGPTAHRMFARLHEAEGRCGDPSRFGRSAAVLLGDLFLTWSDELLATSGMPADALVRAWPAFGLMRTELTAGQYLDLTSQADPGDPARARFVARYKTARYTVVRPLQLGGLLADASRELLACYAAFGQPLGEAFQLRDDVLGLFGDPAVTGKPVGDDLRDGRGTGLLALALSRAAPADRARLRSLAGQPHLDAAGLAEARRIIVASGALEAAEAEITERTRMALDALARIGLDDQTTAALTGLAQAATARHS